LSGEFALNVTSALLILIQALTSLHPSQGFCPKWNVENRKIPVFLTVKFFYFTGALINIRP
jgi:hypothetical protein